MISFYDFLYSYRKSIDSGLPDITSQTTIDALKMLKKIENEISSSINHFKIY